MDFTRELIEKQREEINELVAKNISLESRALELCGGLEMRYFVLKGIESSLLLAELESRQDVEKMVLPQTVYYLTIGSWEKCRD